MDEKTQKPNKLTLKILALALGTLTSHLLWGHINTLPTHEADQFQKKLRAETPPYVKAPSFQMQKPLVHVQAPSPQKEIAQLHVKEPVLLPDTMPLLSEEEFFGMSWDERDRYLAHLPEGQLVAFFTSLSQKGRGESYRHLPYRAKKIFWRWLDLEQQGRNFGYIPTSERRLCFEGLDTKWRNWRIGLLSKESEQFEVFPLLSEEGKKKYCEGLSPEKLQRLIAYLPPEEQQGIPEILTVEALLLQWKYLPVEERDRRFTELPLEKRADYWSSLSQQGQKYKFQYLPESERVNLWPSFDGDEDSQIWNFRYLPKSERLELWPKVSDKVRRCNFQSFSDVERVQLWRHLNEFGRGVNFQYLPLSVNAHYWSDLGEGWRSSNFRHLRAADRMRFWHTLDAKGRAVNFQYLNPMPPEILEHNTSAGGEGVESLNFADEIGSSNDNFLEEPLVQSERVIAWSSLDQVGRDRNFGYLPQEVRLDHWNELTPQGKRKNYWYLTPEQRLQLSGLSQEEAEIDPQRFESWPMWKKIKFWKRIEASSYDSYPTRHPQALLPIDQLVYEDDVKLAAQYSMNPKPPRSSSQL